MSTNNHWLFTLAEGDYEAATESRDAFQLATCSASTPSTLQSTNKVHTAPK